MYAMRLLSATSVLLGSVMAEEKGVVGESAWAIDATFIKTTYGDIDRLCRPL